MNITPEVMTRKQVTDQIQAMSEQRQHLETQVLALDHRIKMIESSMSENDVLQKQIKELTRTSLEHFKTEWHRHGEYFPDIYLNLLLKTIDLYSK